MSKLRLALKQKKIAAMVVTALDEIAWLFNLRGNDIPYTPVFRAYAIIDEKKTILYLPPEKHSLNVKEHLRSRVSSAYVVLCMCHVQQQQIPPKNCLLTSCI